jgi:hypothetical protein
MRAISHLVECAPRTHRSLKRQMNPSLMTTFTESRSSRDSGVDAVIFDPDPIKGGKTVIQALLAATNKCLAKSNKTNERETGHHRGGLLRAFIL